MEICSIGSSGISAEEFFETLRNVGATSIVDTRLHASSQLAGFTKKSTLGYLAPELLHIPYFHEMLLAPEAADLRGYRHSRMSWDEYAKRYKQLLKKRDPLSTLDITRWGTKPVLLCSEPQAEKCHRRLAAEYLQKVAPEVQAITHLEP